MATASLSEATTLIKRLCRQCSFALARRVFDEMPERDVVAWTSMISGYASNGLPRDAFSTFCCMVSSGVLPNRYTVSSVLTACRGLQSPSAGAAVHGIAVRRGISDGSYVENALLDLYASCGYIADAELVFEEMTDRTVVSWTSMITCYARSGNARNGILLFKRMIHEIPESNAFPFSITIHASGSIGCIKLGRQLHALVVKAGHDSSLPVANSLLDMYSRCLILSEACQFFGEMPQKDLISWNAMIASLERSNSHEALLLFLEMGSQDLQPNNFTFCSVMAACANLAILSTGQQVHACIIRRGYPEKLQVANAVIDMYAKCGTVADSRKVFDELTTKDLVTWTSLLIGYGMNSCGNEAIKLFDEMTSSGFQPDFVLFLGIITACSHAGLVDHGLRYFSLMSSEYNVPPTKEVYGCVVDLLGRAGRVTEAHELIKTMSFEPDEKIWGALLGACQIHKNAELGRLAAQKILDMKPNDTKTYISLSSIHAAGNAWEDFAEARRSLREKGYKKDVGISSIEVGNEIFSFVACDRSNPYVIFVFGVLEELAQHMNQDKFELDLMLHDFTDIR
ncbi:putative pentatricopeptide repeat-containing protein At1g56570 [Zingiber officinale]|nr:putative pentatricopeptide repeat-containing protein At1g56570 [Zingiber officinale]